MRKSRLTGQADEGEAAAAAEMLLGHSWEQCRQLALPMLRAGVSVLVRGNPGVGKSALAASIAADLGLQMIDIRLAQRDPADISGVYFPNQGQSAGPSKLCLVAPDWVLDATENARFIFLDEINAAVTRLHQAAAYQIVLERRVGPHKFHPGTVVMAAGNLPDDKAIVSELSSALANRFAHLTMRIDHQSWMTWAEKEGLDDRVLGFIASKGNEALYKNLGDAAFPSPRTWAMAAKIIPGVPEDLIMDAVGACVGTAAAEDFRAWLDLYGRVDPERIINEGEMIDFNAGENQEPSFQYAAVFAVGSWVTGPGGPLDKTRARNLAKFIFSNGLDAEYQYLLLRRIWRDTALVSLLKAETGFRKSASKLAALRMEMFR